MCDLLRVEVAYVDGPLQLLRVINVKEGASVREAIEASGIAGDASLQIDRLRVGIFSRAITLDTIVKHGDRVEIYRPLKIDPMEARRKRAKTKR